MHGSPSKPVRRTAALLIVIALVAIGLAACAGAPGGTAPAGGATPQNAATPPAASGKDFALVAYQGEEILGGKDTTFSQVFRQGKPVVLNFWAGQCPPCRAEMPEFQRVADEYAGKAVFVGIDVGPFTGLGTHDDAQRLLQDLDIRYPAAYAVDATPLQPYGVRAMPTTVYLSAAGQVQSTVNGAVHEDDLRTTVEALVGAG